MNGKSPDIFPAEALEHLSDEEFWNYAHQRALPSPTEAETYPEEYLRCQLSRGDYLIPLAALHEVVLPPQCAGKGQPYASLPATPAWMVGLFTWRGETIAVIDLDAYLVSRNDPGSSFLHDGEVAPMLLIADCSGLVIGLLVSAVGSTASGRPQGIAPTIHERQPATTSGRPQGIAPTIHERQPEYSGRSGLPVLDLPAILADVVQQIRDA